jgi:hypothetical protein
LSPSVLFRQVDRKHVPFGLLIYQPLEKMRASIGINNEEQPIYVHIYQSVL